MSASNKETGNFKTERVHDHIVIRCYGGLLQQQSEELLDVAEAAYKFLSPEIKGLVLDVNQNKEVGQQFLRVVLQIQRSVRQQKMELFVVNASKDWMKFVTGQGISIQNFASIEQLIEKTSPNGGKSAKRLDVNFINPFIEGTRHTLKTMCGLDTTPGKPFLKTRDTPIQMEIAGVIGLSCPAFKGSISITFTEKVFLAVMGKMLSSTFTEITKDLEDGTAELLNIIFGQAKMVLNEKGYAIEMAIPSVIRGTNLQVHYYALKPTVVLPFDSIFGKFHIEICIEGSAGADSPFS